MNFFVLKIKNFAEFFHWFCGFVLFATKATGIPVLYERSYFDGGGTVLAICFKNEIVFELMEWLCLSP